MTTKERIETQVDNEVSALRSTAVAGEVVPQRVLIAPWGRVESTNGDFVVDEESARSAVEAFEAHGTDLPIDYEHQTLGGGYASPSGQAPAAGWIKRLFAEPGVGLLAEIEWTDQAKKMLAGKEYRYLSPVAIVRRNDRKLAAIHSAALTNKPAIVNMTPLISRLNLPIDEDDENPLATLKAGLNLPAEADVGTVLLAAGERLADLQRQAGRRHVEERIGEAMRAGKLVEAQREWAEALVAREEALFDEWFRTAPVIIQPGKSTPPEGFNGEQRRKQTVAAKARSEYRTNPMLKGFTSEEAYGADAVREAEAV